ncbi:MAG: CAAX prenyl protease-related protein [Phycisphaerae bacterium]|nr:CAAX prenyl protease-related protein [Phycisphaerae bacterium]MDW8263218.1 CAAX prenyl protease-related protein [Phycisphaerales bacterium]
MNRASEETIHPPRRRLVGDDWAYMLPMFTFLGFVWLGSTYPQWYPHTYVARCICAGTLLVLFWRQYTPISWNGWWLGLIVGIVGIFQWVGMQLLLQRLLPDLFAPDPARVFDPTAAFSSPLAYQGFLVIRWIIGASLIVPVMEELFWRDFVWRTIIAPSNFKLARIGERDWKAFFGVAFVFAVVHGNWWLTSIVWALLIGWLLLRTKSIGACIVAHSTTNFLLGAYVLYTRDWSFW